jgi:hypothetical protein
MTTAPTPTPRQAGTHFVLPALLVLVAVLAVLVVYLLVHYDVFGSSSSGTTVGSGVAVSQTRSVGPFEGVELAGSNIVSVRVGQPQAVIVHADSNLVDRVTTVVRRGRLVIGNTGGGFSARSPMNVSVTAPSLESLTLSGSGTVNVTGVKTSRLTVELPGSGSLFATGRADRLDTTISGSGNAQLGQLIARDARATVSGSGQIALTATNSLDALVSGSGVINYGGNPPHVLTRVTGSGTVTP